jgi:hypothetical protein
MSESERSAEWTARVARLERRERRMTAIVVMLLLLTITTTAWHLLPGTGAMFASSYWLQNGNQPLRGGMYLSPDGTAALRLNNEHGEARAFWSLRKDGSLELRLANRHFIPRIDLNVDPQGSPSIALTSPAGKQVRLWFDGEVARLDGVTPRNP